MVILVLSSHGSKLGKNKQMFKISIPENIRKEELFAAEQVEEIIIDCTASLSTEAIKLAAKYAIPILIMGGREVLSFIHPLSGHGTVAVRREQIKAYEDYRGVNFVRTILQGASKNKIKIIKEIIRKKELEEEEKRQIEFNLNIIQKVLNTLFFAKEAEITKRYFECFKIAIKESFGFTKRTRRPTTDPVNALLSYGYTILTAQIHKAVIIAGLEPYAGFLHTDRSGKVSFVLDLIEVFRQPVVDRLVLTLINKKMIKEEDFEHSDACMMKEGFKKKYLQFLFERLREENITYKKKKTSFLKIFVDQAREVGKSFVLGTVFEPFQM
ncbi:MAG: CRISPR-associated endonuclease Cas1 [Candidatus Heimdallarchaeaceae archaeon]